MHDLFYEVQYCKVGRQQWDLVRLKEKMPLKINSIRDLCGPDGTRTRDLCRDRAAF